ANIPHGTAFVAQGIASVVSGAPVFPAISISPFSIGEPNSATAFPEQNLAVATQFRTAAIDIPDVVQTLLDNPNSLLAVGTAGKNIASTTVLNVATIPLDPPTVGGGVNNIGFLVGAGGGPNAQAAEVNATFWIETILNEDGSNTLQLQYSQRVLLNF